MRNKKTKNRIILHIDMDYFFAQVEERENPQFKWKPVVVGADPKGGRGRGVVSTANYIARKFGIHSGMPISKAWQLCSKAVFLPVNMELYQKVSEKIMEIIKKYSPKWEIVSVDEAYLDISFLKSFKSAENLAKKLKEEIFKKEKLTSTIGIGPNKLIAKIASSQAKPYTSRGSGQVRPRGLLIVKPSQVQKFLRPLDVQEIPGIGPKTDMRITQSLSLHSRIYANGPMRIKIRDLKKVTKSRLKEILGKVGEDIYNKVRGIDKTEVSSGEIIKSIGREYTFQKDTRDPEIIFSAFEKIIKDVWQRIKENKLEVNTIIAICRFQGFETKSRQKAFREKIQDSKFLEKTAKKLLLELLLKNKKMVRLVGLRTEG